ncbi:glycosyltransferase family 87 protein [Elizabethkingia bruuniana]|uniref:glycosyltransferase family 87 protein n=1 Tax=Elizabethkingia bruuniana TaxID=1756149 RepID=UPI00099A502B|nr:glycosyltransferase family 87 protein [Elizabethkingia bruuniana]OPC54126.1 hypothetical protein BAY07_09950 [Elizabethkingia bruuniana]OPC64801.1 hypothetical protein BAY13_03570 [Elizabethkingia bruuniana]
MDIKTEDPKGFSLSFLNYKTSFWLLLLGFLIISALLLIQTYNRALRIPDGNDFTLYLNASRNFFEPKNPYIIESEFDFLYPQTLCILLYPLTLINYKVAILIWYFSGLIALYISFNECFKMADSNGKINKYSLFFLSFIMLFAIAQDNFLNGQVNFIVLCFCVLFFKYLRKSQYILSALFLALAISIKVTPLIFLGFLFFYKELKISVLAVVFSAILIIGIPVLLTNLDFVFSNYKHYLDIFILHRTTNFSESNLHSGYSLTMFLSKYFGKYALIVSAAVSLVYLLIKQLREKTLSPLVFAGYLLCILLISPMSEQHHLIFTFPLLLLLLTSNVNRIINLIVVLLFITFSSLKIEIFISLLILYAALLLQGSKEGSNAYSKMRNAQIPV